MFELSEFEKEHGNTEFHFFRGVAGQEEITPEELIEKLKDLMSKYPDYNLKLVPSADYWYWMIQGTKREK